VAAGGFLHSNGILLEGRNRLQIGAALELDRPIERFDLVDPVAYILSENVVRGHLTDGQKAFVAEGLGGVLHGGDRKSEKIKDASASLICREKAAEIIGIDKQAISHVRVIAQYAPGAAKIVQAGKSLRIDRTSVPGYAVGPPSHDHCRLACWAMAQRDWQRFALVALYSVCGFVVIRFGAKE
jgi:hypothetical protein